MNIPEVFSVRRCAIVGDGLFYGLNVPYFEQKGDPIPVVRHGIRGTQNQNKGETVEKVANVQVTESAKTFPENRAVLVTFPLRFLPLRAKLGLSSCSGSHSQEFRDAYENFIDRAIDSGALQILGNRMARNLFNGRWLWRNRQIGQAITVRVQYGTDSSRENLNFTQDALQTSLRDFEQYSAAELAVGERIAQALAENDSSGILVSALIDLGFRGSVEVYPSQNYTSNKPKGFARPLYKVNVSRDLIGSVSNPLTFTDTLVTGLAALRDQKIWNAIRTIDTWYQDDSQRQPILPIPVEPLGANLEMNTIYRNHGNGSLFDKDMLPNVQNLNPESNAGLFVLACLIRGGVFGGKDPDKPATTNGKSKKTGKGKRAESKPEESGDE